MQNKRVTIIGSGFSGISCATHLADKGYSVTVLEKNDSLGGRARKFEVDGFIFDMGPSWYWMPDVFDSYFETFGKTTSDYYDLVRLSPSYRIFYSEDEMLDVPSSMDELYELFEKYELGSSKKLKKFLKEAEYKYQVGISEFVYKPGLSIAEFLDVRVFKSVFRLQMLNSIASVVDKNFKHPHLRQLLKFPVLFLGATPEETPAMYSLMNYADLVLGTWYPKGGMHKVIEGMVALAEEKGVSFQTNCNVGKIEIHKGRAKRVKTSSGTIETDFVVSSADYHHTDTLLLDSDLSNYSAKYWDERTMAPSSILYYVGVSKKLEGLKHHSLFFDKDFEKHAKEIYKSPQWPSDPLFYVCAPSRTDDTVAPEGNENLFFLIPTAPGLKEDNEEVRNKYFKILLQRFKEVAGYDIEDDIVYMKSFAVKDFESEYNAFKGNAYGLANTLKQTALFKPSIKNKKVNNLYYTGQLTNPGPGVPPSLISGQVVAAQLIKEDKL